MVLVDLPEGDADAPGLAPLGSDGGAQRFALQVVSEDANFWHPEQRVGTVRVGSAWPSDVTMEQAPALVGFDAHAWGRIAPAPDGGIVATWFHGDEAAGKPTGVRARHVDVAPWAPGAEHDVDTEGELAYGLSPGPGVSGGGFAGDGFAVPYRSVLPSLEVVPRVAVVDVDGNVVMTGVSIAAPRAYPGVPIDAVGIDGGYLVAAAFGECLPADLICVPDSTLVARFDAPSSVAVTAVYAAAPGQAPRRPALARFGDRVWLAWTEAPAGVDAAPRRVRLARLDGAGQAVGDEVLAEAVPISLGVQLGASDAGVAVAWGEIVDAMAPPTSSMHSRLVVHGRDDDGAQVGPPVVLATPSLAYAPAAPLTPTIAPRGFLLPFASTAGTGPEGPKDVVSLARVDCRWP